jgi:hypothetical protein
MTFRFFYSQEQLDPEVYINVLQDENTRLKVRVQNLVDELTALENQRGGKYIFYRINLSYYFFSYTTI